MPKTTAPRATRTPKSAVDKAVEARDVVKRFVDKLDAKAEVLAAQLEEVETELVAARKRLAYLQQSPDLPENAEAYEGKDEEEPPA